MGEEGSAAFKKSVTAGLGAGFSQFVMFASYFAAFFCKCNNQIGHGLAIEFLRLLCSVAAIMQTVVGCWRTLATLATT